MQLFTSVLLGAICVPFALFAQESPKQTNPAKTPTLVIGANAGLFQAYDHYYGVSKTSPSVGLFARYYLSDHLALESGIRFGGYGPRTIQSYIFGGHQRVTTQTVSVPVHLQYHLLSSNNRIRPYFGLGAGMTRKFYQTVFMDISGLPTSESKEVYNDPFFQFTQGLTWQINKDLQLNQSVYYQRDRVGNFGFEVGLGYTIR